MLKVLIVEDNQPIRRHLMRLIEEKKDKFMVAGAAINGARALKLLEETEVDIILTDIRMPVMDGLEMAKIVTSEYPNIKIAIISGYGEFEYARTAMKLGVTEYLLKPVARQEFDECLDRLEKMCVEWKENNKRLSTEVDLEGLLNCKGADEIQEEYVRLNRLFSPVFMHKDKEEFLRLLKMRLKEWVEKEYTVTQIRSFLLEIANMIIKLSKETRGIDVVLGIDNILYLSHTFNQLEEIILEYFQNLFDRVFIYPKYSKNKLCLDIKNYLKEHVYQSVSMQDIAAYFHVSPSYASRVFKSVSGESPMNFFNQLKIEEAKKMLIDDKEMLIKDIAALLCFTDQHHFSKMFKSVTGKSPVEYRKEGSQ